MTRLKAEFKILTDDGYIISPELDADTNMYTATSVDNITYKIIFDSDYPFRQPSINNIPIIILDNTPRTSIKTLLEQSRKPLFIVYCHNKSIKQPDDHFMYDIFNSIANNTIDKYILKTVDIIGTPDILRDGFSIEFCKEFEDKIDILFLPDCGGEWYLLMETGEPSKIYELIKQLMIMVKKTGTAYFSKLFIAESVIDSIIKLLNCHKFIAKKDIFVGHDTPYIKVNHKIS